MKKTLLQTTVLLAVVSLTTLVFADENPADNLGKKYRQYLSWRQQSTISLPTRVFSTDKDGTLKAEIHAVLPYDFSTVAPKLTSPANWCEMVPLVLNVKACAHQAMEGHEQLTFYVGRKHYIPLEKAYALKYQFSPKSLRKDYLHIVLSAEKGPVGTKDYLLEFEALAVGENTFFSVRTSYSESRISGFATRAYLSTLGQGKIGFTVIGGDDGNPEYIGGIRGIIERNAIRYYLALQAYLETSQLPPEKRFEAAANRWHYLTEQYHAQLYEMDKADYLKMKHREYLRQLKLQETIKESQ